MPRQTEYCEANRRRAITSTLALQLARPERTFRHHSWDMAKYSLDSHSRARNYGFPNKSVCCVSISSALKFRSFSRGNFCKFDLQEICNYLFIISFCETFNDKPRFSLFTSNTMEAIEKTYFFFFAQMAFYLFIISIVIANVAIF